MDYIWLVSESWNWMSMRSASVSGVHLNCIWKLNLNEYQNGVHIWSVSELYLKIESEWVSEWHSCLEHIWTVSKLESEWISEWHPRLERIWTVSKVESEWVSEWHPCLERIRTVSESCNWMSIRMAFVSGAYLNCIKRCLWMSIRMASMSGAYLYCIKSEN